MQGATNRASAVQLFTSQFNSRIALLNAELRSRNNKDFTTRYSSIADALKKCPKPWTRRENIIVSVQNLTGANIDSVHAIGRKSAGNRVGPPVFAARSEKGVQNGLACTARGKEAGIRLVHAPGHALEIDL
jgi:hypothetical protein